MSDLAIGYWIFSGPSKQDKSLNGLWFAINQQMIPVRSFPTSLCWISHNPHVPAWTSMAAQRNKNSRIFHPLLTYLKAILFPFNYRLVGFMVC
jgi:hypothetical protein